MTVAWQLRLHAFTLRSSKPFGNNNSLLSLMRHEQYITSACEGSRGRRANRVIFMDIEAEHARLPRQGKDAVYDIRSTSFEQRV